MILSHLIQPATIKDARGRRVQPIDPLTARCASRTPEDRESLDALRRRVGAGVRGLILIAVVIGLTGLLLAGGVILARFVTTWVRSGSFDISKLLAGAPAYIGVGLGLQLVWIVAQRERRLTYAPLLISSGRCAGCAYPLAGTKADEQDGATVCPECGAAWRGVGDVAV